MHQARRLVQVAFFNFTFRRPDSFRIQRLSANTVFFIDMPIFSANFDDLVYSAEF